VLESADRCPRRSPGQSAAGTNGSLGRSPGPYPSQDLSPGRNLSPGQGRIWIRIQVRDLGQG